MIIQLSYTKLINDLLVEVKLISTKKVTKDFINEYSILNGAKYSVEDGSQNYLVFQPVFKYFRTLTGTVKIFVQKFEGLSKEIVPYFSTPVTSDNSFDNGKIGSKFKGNCLLQDNVSFTQSNVVNIFIVYKLDTCSRDLKTDFTLSDCLFGAVKLTKNADPDKHGYSTYDIGLDTGSQFSLSNHEWGKDVIFGVSNSSSVHAVSKEKRCFSSW